MSYYSVLAVTPTSEERIAAYIPASMALVAKHGGKYVARTSGSESHHFLIEAKDDHA